MSKFVAVLKILGYFLSIYLPVRDVVKGVKAGYNYEAETSDIINFIGDTVDDIELRKE